MSSSRHARMSCLLPGVAVHRRRSHSLRRPRPDRVPVVNDEGMSVATKRFQRHRGKVRVTAAKVSVEVRDDFRIGGRPEARGRYDRANRERRHDQKSGVKPCGCSEPSRERICAKPASVRRRELRCENPPGDPPDAPSGLARLSASGPISMPAPRTPAPVSIALRSGTRSSRRGRARAATIEPAPNAARARATSRSPRPKPDFTITTVLTITIAPAASTATFGARRPRSRGVAR